MTQQKQSNKLNPIPYFILCFITTVMFDFVLTNHILHNIFISTDNFKFIDIVYVQNTGAAFSSFQHSTLLLVVASVLIVSILLYELFRDINKYSLATFFAAATLISGIFCNTYERITLGYVRDFLSFKFINFPVFNISDILINISVLAIIVLIITKNYKRS